MKDLGYRVSGLWQSVTHGERAGIVVGHAGSSITPSIDTTGKTLSEFGMGDLNTTPGAPLCRVQYVIQTGPGEKGGPDLAPDSTPITINIECVPVDNSTCTSSAPQRVTQTLGELRSGERLTFDFTEVI